MRDAFATVKRSSGTGESGHRLWIEFLVVVRDSCEGTGERLNENFEKAMHGG